MLEQFIKLKLFISDECTTYYGGRLRLLLKFIHYFKTAVAFFVQQNGRKNTTIAYILQRKQAKITAQIEQSVC